MLFPSIDVCFYWLARISKIDNRLVTACKVKTAKGVRQQGVTLEKCDSVRVCSDLVGVFCLRAPQLMGLAYIAFRTTKVKDIKLPLAVIPF